MSGALHLLMGFFLFAAQGSTLQTFRLSHVGRRKVFAQK
jgi:hypothetical protein